ncbi:hypothetical protein L1766_07960 [Thermovorax subterraneus]|nr:hypothetical protein [Thermovorax subterraneus]
MNQELDRLLWFCFTGRWEGTENGLSAIEKYFCRFFLNKQAQLQIPFNLTETFPLQENSIMILFKKILFYFILFYIVSKEDAEKQLENAEKFLAAVRNFLESNFGMEL